ncbi:hypothetical protein [Oceanobacillus jeddahense]|uniref:Uncharacterized protein n=1 Tax=Oceanobacillus jeddahense TaxID=1462527 RepID=A0ABY5JRZ5_9BACI|nr:hypothetical protein [Oceanobacillus jeddahense]UUI01841.1 hypothetical protein NP439_17545 [Oceanobacillus jeddahense]
MTRFLSHHELENLYYMYGKYEDAYQTLLERKQEYVQEEKQRQIEEQMEIVKKQQLQMLASLT